MYQDLVEMEKKLDWTMLRKKVEIQDALGKPAHVSKILSTMIQALQLQLDGFVQTTRTLRIFLSHTSSDQAWQREAAQSAEQPNFETGTGIAAWSFKVEGRVLDVRLPPSHFLSSDLSQTLFYSLQIDLGIKSHPKSFLRSSSRSSLTLIAMQTCTRGN